ncbi:hypothetical protein OF83DRAFT_1170942 [Amylostereum chailletii]|nr:hypothetical protein OF83DRAFT_1170942 [Amylostereum chailletii]
MPPGNFPPFTTARKTLSFDELRRDALNNPDRKPWRTPARRLEVTDMYNPPEEIQSAVKVRDGDRCFLTGSDGPPSVHWIVPPIWTRKFTQRVENGSSKGYMRALKASYSTAENAAMMCEEVADLFHRNAVGIDVDNDFRFIVFDSQLRKRMDDNPGFLKLQNKDNLTGGTVNFLRQHLKWCLSVNFIAEDTVDEFPMHEVHDISCLMATRDLTGLKAYGKGEEGTRWKTNAGKEIWDLLLSRAWDAEDSEDIWDGFSDSESEDDSDSGTGSEVSSDDGSAAAPSSGMESESDSSESD